MTVDPAVVVKIFKRIGKSVSFHCYHSIDNSLGGIFIQLTGYLLLINKWVGKPNLHTGRTISGTSGLASLLGGHPPGFSPHK